MIRKPLTERICDLLRIYDSGLIDTPTYIKRLRVLQDEFLSPEVIGPELKTLNLEP